MAMKPRDTQEEQRPQLISIASNMGLGVGSQTHRPKSLGMIPQLPEIAFRQRKAESEGYFNPTNPLGPIDKVKNKMARSRKGGQKI